MGRGRADVRDSEWSGRRGLFLRKLDTIRDYGKYRSVRHLGMKGSSLREVKRDAERTIVVAVAIRVVVELQPKREHRHEQGNGEGEP